MKAANERRIISANNIFAAISGLLVVIHAFSIHQHTQLYGSVLSWPAKKMTSTHKCISTI